MKKMRKSKSWLVVLRTLKNAKLPWIHYIISTTIGLCIGYVYSFIPQLEGFLASGDFSPELIKKYVLYSIIGFSIQLVSIYTIWVDVTFNKRLQKHAWRQMIKLPFNLFERFQPSSLISRVTEDSSIISRMIGMVLSLFTTLFMAVMMVKNMFDMNRTLTLLTIPLMILNAICFVLARYFVYDIGYAMQDATSKLTAFISERMSAMRLIKAACAEEQARQGGYERSHDRFKANMREVKYNTFILGVLQVTTALLTGIVLIGGAVYTKRGLIPLHVLLAFYSYSLSLPNTMQQIVQTILQLKSAQGGVEVVTGIADLPSEQIKRSGDAPAFEEGLSFSDVSFTYPETDRPVLQNLNLHIPKGKTTAIVGPSGSGKTTMLKLLERFYEPTEGAILFDGVDVKDYNLDTWRRRFGYIVQNSPLLSGTIRDNILYGARREFSEEELVEIAKQAQIYDFICTLEKGFDTEVGPEGSNLSGGQRQRIAIARALAAEPEILIMDEATSSLDAKNSKEVRRALQNAMKGKTVIVVAHQISTIRNADQVVTLMDGAVEASGTHEELCGLSGYYKRYCTLQNLSVN